LDVYFQIETEMPDSYSNTSAMHVYTRIMNIQHMNA